MGAPNASSISPLHSASLRAGFDEGVRTYLRINPLSAHFSLIEVSDLILVGEDGNGVEGDEPVNLPAFAIHSEIHKARPDVNAACHATASQEKPSHALGSHALYREFRGLILDGEEGKRIAQALGEGKATILQNHGLLTVGQSVDEAGFWFISLDKTCHAQLLADAAAAGGYKIIIDKEGTAYSAPHVGGPEKGWLAFQLYYDEQVAKTKGEFLL
ncbi:class II aldolase/adducin N-terminal [Aspergillus desertorum]